MASKVVTMDIGSGRTISFNVREEVVKYFNIKTASEGAIKPRERVRKAFEYRRRKLGDAGEGTLVRVKRSVWYDVGSSASKPGSGKAIIVPTGLKTTKENERMCIIRIPAVAINLAISKWIYSNFDNATRRPGYFITPSGVRIPVLNVTTPDVNPGEKDAAETPSAA